MLFVLEEQIMSHRDELISTVKELLGSGTYNSYVFREPSVVEMTFHTPVKVLNISINTL